MNILDVKIRDVDEMLSVGVDRVNVYADASQNGTFSALIGFVPLTAGKTDYEFADPTGNPNSWYKLTFYNSSTTYESAKSEALQNGPLTGPIGLMTPNQVRLITDFAGLANLNDLKLGNLIFRAESILQRFADRYGGWATGAANYTQTLTTAIRLLVEELYIRSLPSARMGAVLGIMQEKIGTYSYSRSKNIHTQTLGPWDIRQYFSPEVFDALVNLVQVSPSHVRMQTTMVFPQLDPLPDPSLKLELRPYWDGLDEELMLGADPLHNSLGTRRIVIYPQR